MKYRFLVILLSAVLSAGVLTGCSKKESSTDSGTQQTSEEKESGGDASGEEEAEEENSGEEDTEEETFQDETSSEEDSGSGEESADAGDEELDQFSSAVVASPVELDTSKPLTGTHHVEILIKDHGKISVELDADAAPLTVTNFVKLVQDDFYDGLTFHRIMDGFMMQGGDPLGNGTGGSSETIKGEFSDNGVENPLSHTRGAISMARSSAPDSASSQFFIVQSDSTFLDGSYAAFGYVTEGMDIVDEICKAAGTQDRTIPASEQPVIEDILVID